MITMFSHENVPAVSVVICTKDRGEDLKRAIASLKDLQYPSEKLEIVVVQETDDPQPMDGVEYIPIPRENRGMGYTRNMGVENSSNDIVAFTDDDCLVERDWLVEIVRPLDKPGGVVGAAGSVKVKDCNLIGYCENVLGFPGGGALYAHQSGGKLRDTRCLSTCNCAYYKDEILAVGGFDENLRFGSEDFVLGQAVSSRNRCVYNPAATVYHKTRGSLRANFHWFVRRGRAEVALFKVDEHPGDLIRRMLRSSITIKALFALFLLLVFRLPLFLILSLIPVYYSVIAFRFRFSYQYFDKSLGILLLTPLVKMAMDLGMDSGRILGFWQGLHRE